jgi:radical SAM superfamily enzyme YgiQ (UPF0313 family)
MNLLLVHTQHDNQRFGTGVYKRHLRYAPTTMATLAALVPPELGASVRVIDEMIEPVDYDHPADLVALTAITSAAPHAYEVARRFREKGVRTVLGGVHATLMTAEALEHVDAVVRGYAEELWPSLLRDFAGGRLQRVYETSRAPDEKALVAPDRRHIRRREYIACNTVEMSRGCTKRCDFCVTHRLNEHYLVRDVDRVLAEIRALPGKLVTFLDPNVIGNIPYARSFFQELRKLKRWWVGCVSIDVVRHPDLLDLLVQSGARGFLIGFESLSQAALDGAGKSFATVAEYEDAIDLLHRKGVLVQGSFVLGFDEDDRDTFQRTVDFVQRTKIDLPQFTIYTPFPGTPVFDRMDAAGRILTRDWSRYNGHSVVFQPRNMTPAELADGFRHVWRSVYSYPSILRRLVGRPVLLKPAALFSNLNFRRFMQRVHAGT